MNRTSALTTVFERAWQSARRLWREDSGTTAIEYAIIAAGIGAFVAGTVMSLGARVSTMWTQVAGLFQ
jgi:Flp pilus assembly pilin Flp